ncbi:hypothetical protein AWV79_35440 [Cupriavidus sp. UYMMa02A]|nr:hypothetical protein AWV79_35440 [Cupriavidus sp. UYMMa02A]
MSIANNSSTDNAANQDSVDVPSTQPTWRGLVPQLIALYDEDVDPLYAYSELLRMAHFADVSADVVDDLLQILQLAAAGDVSQIRAVARNAIQRYDAVPPPATMTLDNWLPRARGSHTAAHRPKDRRRKWIRGP